MDNDSVINALRSLQNNSDLQDALIELITPEIGDLAAKSLKTKLDCFRSDVEFLIDCVLHAVD